MPPPVAPHRRRRLIVVSLPSHRHTLSNLNSCLWTPQSSHTCSSLGHCRQPPSPTARHRTGQAIPSHTSVAHVGAETHSSRSPSLPHRAAAPLFSLLWQVAGADAAATLVNHRDHADLLHSLPRQLETSTSSLSLLFGCQQPLLPPAECVVAGRQSLFFAGLRARPCFESNHMTLLNPSDLSVFVSHSHLP